jgi:hypothetical protein
MRRISKKQEEKIAEIIGGKVVPGSGSTDFKKGDVENKYSLIECKTLAKPRLSHTIKKNDLEKIQQQAFEAGKEIAVLAFDFGDSKNYFILDEKTFLNVMQVYFTKICDEGELN